MPSKRRLPVLIGIRLRRFSLYQNRRTIDIEVRPGVFCLAGANGLGKSSFLAAVNFAYTGIVASPRRVFRTVDNYYQDSITFSKRFFDGRIDQEDRNGADIDLTFSVGAHLYEMTRNLFEPEALRSLTVTDSNGSVLLETSDWEPDRRHKAYCNRIVEDCNLANFDYFVFLQHFLLTFDERRHLLFWDQRAMNVALYLAFGVEPRATVRAEELRHEIDSADSNARNAQWQATIARNRIAALAGQIVPGLEELRERRDRLIEVAENTREEADHAQKASEDARLSVAEASARHMTLRRRYDQLFARRMAARRDPTSHPTIRATLGEHLCDVCGSDSKEAIATIMSAIEAGICPLCSSPLESPPVPIEFEELTKIDNELAKAKATVDSAQAAVERHTTEAAALAVKAAEAAEELSSFEAAHSRELPSMLSVVDDVTQQKLALESEYRNAVARRDEYRARRDDLRDELAPLLMRLSSAYEQGELQFVPEFRRLAKRFIGLDLDVSLDQSQGTFGLSLEVQGHRRRATTELSESQRFFLDIALRMALALHMSDSASPAGLLVDTPEGSLDIAYEARAGDMFADFVEAGFNLIMTANINSSQLLIRLAERCGSDTMQLVRMTEWTPLTEVQAEEEGLFNEAYARIESELIRARNDAVVADGISES